MIEHAHVIPDRIPQIWILLKPAVLMVWAAVTVVLITRQFEKPWPIDPELPRSEVIGDWKVTGFNLILAWAAGPFIAISSTAIVRAAGGGLIHLRTDGWWYGVSLLAFLLVSDLYRYGSHRLYHAVPCLWALHSFHHSAEAITFVTGARHHWLEKAVEGAFFPILAILFEVPGELLTIAAVVNFLPDTCAHLNIRLPLGRAITWVNNPQWHRIHHSTQPEHFNKNFAAVLPLWDFMFGTAWIPGKDEYPRTGLVPGEKCDVMTSIVWPFRHHVRRMKLPLQVWPRRENAAAIRKVVAKVSGTQTT